YRSGVPAAGGDRAARYDSPMIDTHCHLTFDGLHHQADAVVARAVTAGVDHMITVGTTPADAEAAIALAERHANGFVAAGLHPGNVRECPDLDEVRRQLYALAS